MDSSPPEEPEEPEENAVEMSKWNEMIDADLSTYMRLHPDRFHRRVRRGIPTRFRWQVWKAAVRLDERALPQEEYSELSTRRNAWTPLIEIDIRRTFPELPSFDGVQQQRLLRVLNAYASHNPDVGYCQGMNFIAGLLLLVSNNEEETFGVLVCLMDHDGVKGFYGERLPLLRKYLRACDKLVAETVPELREHFIREGVQPAVYLHQWFLTLFINCFPLSMVMIIWDVIVCEGLPVVLRIAVSILQVLKDSLLSMHFEEIIKFFKMMKTYDDEDGELNASRIGQLLMKHTAHIEIPEHILEYLRSDEPADDGNVDIDDAWEADLGGKEGWLQSLSRMFVPWTPKNRRPVVVPPAVKATPAPAAAVPAAPPAPDQHSAQQLASVPPAGASAPGATSPAGTVAASATEAAPGASANRGGDAGSSAVHNPRPAAVSRQNAEEPRSRTRRC